MFRHKLALAMGVLLLVLVAIGAGNAQGGQTFCRHFPPPVAGFSTSANSF